MNHKVHKHTTTGINEIKLFMLQNTQGTSCVSLGVFLKYIQAKLQNLQHFPSDITFNYWIGFNIDTPYPLQQQACIA
jgi:hypothetical protein